MEFAKKEEDQLPVTMFGHPQVGAWNDPWAIVEFVYGGIVGSYVNLISETYGETCYVSVMQIGYDMIEWAKRFNKEIDETLWYQPYLQYFIYALNAFSVVRTAINCMEMSAESTFLKWYELYPFGAPEEQTVEEVNRRITSIKAKLIGKRLKMLLDAEGKSARELAESGDVLDDFEADALEENIDGEEDED